MSVLGRFVSVARRLFCRHEWNAPRSAMDERDAWPIASAFTECRKCGAQVYVAQKQPLSNERLEVRLEARELLATTLNHECWRISHEWWRFL